MPCRPIEYEFGRDDGDVSYAEARRYIADRDEVRHLLEQWWLVHGVPTPVEAACGRVLSSAREGALPQPPGAGEARYPAPQDGNWALEVAFRASREERALCEERSLLARVAASTPPPAELAAAVKRQLERHAEHCEGDREAVIDALDAALAASQRGQFSGHSQTLLRKRDQVRQLHIGDIMQDRDVLKPFWPEA